MTALFGPRADLFVRAGLAGAVLLLVLLALLWWAWMRSAYVHGTGIVVEQPVPFSHAHHVGGMGIDCRYCHTSVEDSAFAGMPSTDTCMNCHWQMWTEAELLEPVRLSWRTGEPIEWNRVTNVPDFVYFNHSAHINNGVGCVQCHGRVDRMPLMYLAQPMYMGWCLNCHENPGPRLRPRDEIFNMAWQPPTERRARQALAQRLLAEYQIDTEGLTDCTTCHR